MQENLTAEDLDAIIEELATVISLADDPDEQTTENLQVVTLGFNSIANLSDSAFNIDEQVSQFTCHWIFMAFYTKQTRHSSQLSLHELDEIWVLLAIHDFSQLILSL